MGKKTADIPSPEEMAPMFEDAAYWNRYNQYTPWGNIVWNDDRTSMTQELPPYMLDLVGQQMGLQSAALGELLNWFGGSPMNLNSAWGGEGGGGDGGDEDGLPGDDGRDPRWIPRDNEDQLKSTQDYTPDEWATVFNRLGVPDVPEWFKGTRHEGDPAAWLRWYTTKNMGVDPSIFGDLGSGWTSDQFSDNWMHSLAQALVGSVDSGGKVPWETGDIGDDGTGDTTPADWAWPWQSGETGGAWGAYGGRQPELFWSEDIPNLEWILNQDAIPDLPTLDQFSADRERITQEMYNQGYSLLSPQLAEEESKRRQSLADRGLPIASEIGLAEMGDFGRSKGQALSNLSFESLMGGYDEAARQFQLGLGAYGAGLQGELARLGAANSARNQAYNERMGVRQQKYNELASILGLMPTTASQTGYSFNPSIDVLGGYGLGTQTDMYNSGVMNQWLNNLFNSISFV